MHWGTNLGLQMQISIEIIKTTNLVSCNHMCLGIGHKPVDWSSLRLEVRLNALSAFQLATLNCGGDQLAIGCQLVGKNCCPWNGRLHIMKPFEM